MTASPARSLLERAAEVYDFESSWKLQEPAPIVPTNVERLWPLGESDDIDFDPGPELVALDPTSGSRDGGICGGPRSEANAPDPEVRNPILGNERDAIACAPVLPAAADNAAPDEPPPDPNGLSARGFVVPEAAPTVLAEEFRLAKRMPLAHAFGSSGQEPSPRGRLLLVCSANPGEGKSFCAINLALSFAAERDVGVVLIDGDVAKPALPNTMGLPDGPGLIDAIMSPSLDPEAMLLPTGVSNLSLLPAGTAANNATELLASGAARALFDRLIDADPRRIVVIDSPPLLAASPALSLTLHVGQAVLVVRADRTTEADLRDSYALLDRCPTVHLLLNGVSYASGRTRLGSYYGVEP